MVALGLAVATPGEGVAQDRFPPLRPPFDSATVRGLAARALRVADSIAAGDRDSSLIIVGRLQADIGDFAGSGRTLARLVASRQAAAAAGRETLPEWWLSGFARNLACRLHDERQPAEALAAIRQLPPGEARDWQLAREAAYLARPARWFGDTTATWEDELARRRRALSLAREVTHRHARLDAMMAIMQRTPDSAAAGQLRREAYAEARRVRVDDADLQSSRDAMLAGEAIRAGLADDAWALYERLSSRQDVLHVVGSATESRDSALMLRLVPRAIAAMNEIRDPQARLQVATVVRKLLERAGGDTLQVALPRAVESTPEGRSKARGDTVAKGDSTTPSHPIEAAKDAVTRGDYSEVMVQVQRLPERDRQAQRALFWYELSRHVGNVSSDSAKAYLRRGREALQRSGADSAIWDGRAWRLAEQQLMLAEHEEGVRTLNLIRSPSWAEAAVDDWGGTAVLLRQHAERVRHPRVRDAVLLQIVQRYLVGPNATPADLNWARALADSIATPSHRGAARMVLANRAAQREDTATARREFSRIVADTAAYRALHMQQQGIDVHRLLISIGDWPTVEAWALGAPTRSERVQRLVGLARHLHRAAEMQQGRWPAEMRTNGPDYCRNEF